MHAHYNAIIDRQYLDDIPPTYIACETRVDAEDALRADLDDHIASGGDPALWRGWIEEVFVADRDGHGQEALRLVWLDAQLQNQQQEMARPAVAPLFPTEIDLIVCECGWHCVVHPEVEYPGSHAVGPDDFCDRPFTIVSEPVVTRDPYGNIVGGQRPQQK